jgi:acyl dehydratase
MQLLQDHKEFAGAGATADSNRAPMAIDYKFLMGLPPRVVTHRYTSRDTILYALGVGAGLLAVGDAKALPFVYEENLAALPTMATILAYPGFWAQEPQYGITWRKLLHRDQSIEIHAEIPAAADVRGEMTIDEIYDRGAEKGALLCFSRRIFNAATNELLATVRQVNVLRADGGFGGPADRTPPGQEAPTRPADQSARLRTGADQALVYRLSGDMNPLHVDPEVARAAGFEKPILHGLATFGLVGLSVVAQLCGYDPRKVRRLDARFSSPVYPGDTLEVSVWHLAEARAAVEARAVERDITVIRNGFVDFRA